MLICYNFSTHKNKGNRTVMKKSTYNYRFYGFAHNWLSSIQKGIQTAHVVSEIMEDKGHNKIVRDWTLNDKTIILLNGGNSSNLYEIKALLSRNTLFPLAHFKEDQESLEGTMTAVGTILPEWYYSNFKAIKMLAKDLERENNTGVEDLFTEGTQALKQSQNIWMYASQLSSSILDEEEVSNINRLAFKIASLKLAN